MGEKTYDGFRLQHDSSRTGQGWKDISPAELATPVLREIMGKIYAGESTVERYIASNGQHYRW